MMVGQYRPFIGPELSLYGTVLDNDNGTVLARLWQNDGGPIPAQ